MKRRLAAALGVVALISVPATALAQTETVTTTPAPPGEAEAVAAELEGVVAVAHTQAGANQSGGSASGNALEVGGNALVGGTQNGTGSTSGALFDTGPSEELRVALLPWEASVSGATDSSSRAALARLVLGDLVKLNVLQSESRASHRGLTSTGDGSSDGVTLDVTPLGLSVVLLHSEGHSTGEGETYVLKVNDQKLLTEDQIGSACNIEVPSLLKVVCMQVAGGAGAVTATAAGANAVQDAVRSQVVSASGAGQPTAISPGTAAPGNGGDGGAPGQLPKTGGVLLSGLIYGFVLLVAGAAVLAAQRARERTALSFA